MLMPSIEIIKQAATSSFLVREFKGEQFDAPFHFHPELELTFIVSGRGSRFVGNHIEDYAPGDLVLLGSHVPHCWKTEEESRADTLSHSIVIHFSRNCLGDEFFDKPELHAIKRLLERSRAGIKFSPENLQAVVQKLEKIAGSQEAFTCMLLFLELLQALAQERNFRLLDTTDTTIIYSEADMQRLNVIYNFLAKNFRDEIRLKEVADLINMSPNAFCRYFKKVSRRTLMETIIQYRLNYILAQLVQTDLPVADICFASGFGNFSHFNKVFKEKMKMSPLQYRKKFSG